MCSGDIPKLAGTTAEGYDLYSVLPMSSDLNFNPSAQAKNYRVESPSEPKTLNESAVSADEIPDFVHLHVHSQYSMLDGATRSEERRIGKECL